MKQKNIPSTYKFKKKIVPLQSFNPHIGENSNIVVTKIEKYDVKFNWI